MEEHGERDNHGGGIVEFGENSRPAVGHGRTRVDDEGDAYVAFVFVLLDVVPVGSGEGAPVEPAEIFTGRVFAVLGKFDIEAVKRAVVHAADRTFDESPRAEREVF